MQTEQDPYSYPGTNILINRFNSKNREWLLRMENIFSRSGTNKILNLPQLRIKAFDENLVKRCHMHLFSKLYPWADGKYRTCNVGIEADHVSYEPPENIAPKMKAVGDYIRKNDFTKMGEGELITNLALVFGTLKNLQPFRDGNTRTSMLFTDLLASYTDHFVDFSLTDYDTLGNATVQARDGNYDPLVMLFAKITVPVNEAGRTLPKIVIDPEAPSFSKQIIEFKSVDLTDNSNKKVLKAPCRGSLELS